MSFHVWGGLGRIGFDWGVEGCPGSAVLLHGVGGPLPILSLVGLFVSLLKISLIPILFLKV